MPSDESTQSGPEWEITARQQGADDLTVTTFARKNRRYHVVTSSDSFADIAYNRFDLGQVCSILRNENPSFVGHRDALAAAFCGWMLDPAEWVPRRRLIALSVGTTLARAEQAATRRSLRQGRTSTRFPRTTRLPPAFFEELYYPIGGLRTLVRTPAPYGIYYELTSQRSQVYDTTMIAAIDHCHYCSTARGLKLTDLSIDRSCDIYVLVEMVLSGYLPPNVANLKSHYLNRYERSIPFLYAASTIRLSEKQTLLRAIGAGKWGAILRQGILPELLGRTVFYTKSIYASNKKATTRVAVAQDILNALPGVEPRTFDPPDRVSACARIIEHGYTDAGYDTCHDDVGKLLWKSPTFWSALGLPVPEYKGRARPSSS